jgi:hypothetical protein
MKVIRVKQANAAKVLAAIPGATITTAPDYDYYSGDHSCRWYGGHHLTGWYVW